MNKRRNQLLNVLASHFTKMLAKFMLLMVPAVVQAQFNYTSSNGVVTITGYTGSGGAVTIPSSINGLPVTCIGSYAFAGVTTLTSVTFPTGITNIGLQAFAYCGSLTSITIPSNVAHLIIGIEAFAYCVNLTSLNIPAGVTDIGFEAFYDCPSLVAITVDPANAGFSSVNGVLFNKDQSIIYQFPGGIAGSFTIPASVTTIGNNSFAYCAKLNSVAMPNSVMFIEDNAFAYSTNLTTVTVGNSVINIRNGAFTECTSLKSIYFKGNAPSVPQSAGVFSGDANATAYYLPGTTGWGNFTTLTGLPTVLWNPQAQTSGGSFGVQTNLFRFYITGSSNLAIVVEACTNLVHPIWSPLSTNILTNGISYFSDPKWTNYRGRFYRFRSP